MLFSKFKDSNLKAEQILVSYNTQLSEIVNKISELYGIPKKENIKFKIKDMYFTNENFKEIISSMDFDEVFDIIVDEGFIINFYYESFIWTDFD